MVINNPFSGMKVVAIDDDANSLEITKILLEILDVEVISATNGEEGIQAVGKVKPDLVITDISMPIMNGWQVLEHLQQDEEFRNIPVIALTAHAMNGDKEKSLEAGFYGYISKPLNPTTFTKDLRTIMQNHTLFTS